ncbi:rhomboid-like protein [Kitasatospora paranensis]|uniref:Rhomboid-like protein n=1 Tax=Kitasatospora paranensis TaxID=258053 RepID=A0ABW2FU39_9ACTN
MADTGAGVPGPYARARDLVVRALPTPRRNPFALLYLALLLGTTLFAHLADPQLVRRLQALSSTDVHNLAHHPVLALVTSGCWVAGPLWTPYLWAVAVTVAPLERRVGGRRAAGVLAAGHVGATLLSQGVVLAAVALGAQGDDLLDALDIGVSYGVLASLGALAGLLAPRGRALALAVAATVVGNQLLQDPDLVTGVGHPVALLIGLALWRPLRRGPRPPRRPLRRPARRRSRPQAAPARV